jgi:hypothetical protein
MVALVLTVWASPALAQDRIPEGRFVLVAGARANTGSLGEAFDRGWVYGFEAGYQPGWLGAAWSLLWGRFDSEDPTRADPELRMLEMHFGLRLRWPLTERTPRFLVGIAGATLQRSNIPIPPDPGRIYAGPFAGLGVEQLILGKYMLAVEGRYGMFVGGPAGLTLLVSLAFGSG